MSVNSVRKKILSSYLVFIFVITGLLGLFLLDNISEDNVVKAAIIIVDSSGNGNYTTIQDAINNANSGDVIIVWAGSFNENINVDKTLTIIGNGTSNTTITGQFWNDIIRITTNGVNITGLNITGTGINTDDACIFLDNVNNCHIFNNKISGNENGISLFKSSGNIIENNSISNPSFAGIGIWHSPNNIVKNNTMLNCGLYINGSNVNDFIQNEVDINNSINGKLVYYYKHQTGITSPSDAGEVILVNCTDSILNNLNFNNGSVSIQLAFCTNITINDTHCLNNTLDGLYLYHSNYNLINNVTLINNSKKGIQSLHSNNNKFKGIDCQGNNIYHYGLFLHDSNNNSANIINCSGGQAGLYLEYSNYNSITSFDFWDNYFAVDFDYSNNNTLRNGSCIKNDAYGLYIVRSNDNRFNNITAANSDYSGYYMSTCLNNVIENNSMHNNDNGIYIPTTMGHTTTGMVFKNNNISNNLFTGIGLGISSNILIENNTFIDNDDYGINTGDISKATIKDNYFFSNVKGIRITYGSDILIYNNSILRTDSSGINLFEVDYTDVFNNNCSDHNYNGIFIRNSIDIKVYNNTCSDNDNHGIEISSNIPYSSIYDNICNNNFNDGIRIAAIKYSIYNNSCKNNNNGILLSNSYNNIIFNNNLINNNASLYFQGSHNNKISNVSNNGGKYGIYLTGSTGNAIDNCTFSSHSNNDIYLKYTGTNNTVVNSSIGSVFHFDVEDELIVKNYLHIYMNDSFGNPIPGVDVKVIDNITTIYSTPGFGGTDKKTDSNGKIKWILVTDQIMNKTGNKDNITKLTVKHPSYTFWNNDREVDMGTSHTEYFTLNSKPGLVTLTSPTNNSYTSDSTPTLTWQAAADSESDPLTYFVEVDDWGGDWGSLVAFNHTNTGILTWDITPALTDGSYQWRVRANDSLQNGSWSNISKFTIDSQTPLSNKPYVYSQYNNTGTIRWWWQPSTDTGSGIEGYYIYIGTTPSGTDVLDNKWVTNTWYEHSGLSDGKTYYCRIKARNGAGTTGSYCPSSDGVLVDLDTPTSSKPLRPSEFNNTGTIRWTWAESYDTGSGIIGYYVYVGTTIDGSDIINGEFTATTYYQATGLVDGNTYYCRIKAENGAETIGEFSSTSDGVLVDLEKPITNKPKATIKFNNTGKVIWSWATADDTGSGITGYYVTISRDPIISRSGSRVPTDDIVIQDMFTTNTWFLATSLQDEYGYYCHVKAINGAGTIGDYSPNSDIVIVDRTPPATPTMVKPVPTTWTNLDSFSVSWLNSIDISGIAGVYYKLDTPPSSNVDGTFISKDGINEILNVSVSTDGEHNFYFWLKDHAGNINYMNHAITNFYLDTTAPASPISIRITPDHWSSQNSFTVDWSVPIDLSGVKTGVYYLLGPSPPKSDIDGSWTDEKPFNITTAREGENKLYLWLEDIAGNKDFENYGIGTIKYDTTPPKIIHAPIKETILGKDIHITAVVMDDNASVSEATLYFKSPAEQNYSKLEMRPAEGSISSYLTKIPGNVITESGIEYYLKAVDRSRPSNIIYFGINRETNFEPTSETDINIKITILPKVVSVTPKGTGISVNTQINITFNNQMDFSSIPKALSISPPTSGSYSWNDTKLTFTPIKPLLYRKTYTVTVNTEAKDIKGNNLVTNHSWSFTTEYVPYKEPVGEDSSDLELVLNISIVVIIFIVIIIILMLFSRKKKKDEEERKSREKELKEKLKSPFEMKLSDKAMKTFNCPNCGATLIEDDKCPYCKWEKQK